MATGTAGSVHLLGPKVNLALVWEASRQELKRVLGPGDGSQKVNPVQHTYLSSQIFPR